MKTLQDVLAYCEQRAGTRLIAGMYVPIGGGLLGLEQAALSSNHYGLAEGYRNQRIELQKIMHLLSDTVRYTNE